MALHKSVITSLQALSLHPLTPKASQSPGDIADAFVLAFLLRPDHGVDDDTDDDDDDVMMVVVVTFSERPPLLLLASRVEL